MATWGACCAGIRFGAATRAATARRAALRYSTRVLSMGSSFGCGLGYSILRASFSARVRWHPRCDSHDPSGRMHAQDRRHHEMDSIRCGLRVDPVARGWLVGAAAGRDTVDTFWLADSAAGDTRLIDSAIDSDASVGVAANGKPAVDAVAEPIGAPD